MNIAVFALLLAFAILLAGTFVLGRGLGLLRIRAVSPASLCVGGAAAAPGIAIGAAAAFDASMALAAAGPAGGAVLLALVMPGVLLMTGTLNTPQKALGVRLLWLALPACALPLCARDGALMGMDAPFLLLAFAAAMAGGRGLSLPLSAARLYVANASRCGGFCTLAYLLIAIGLLLTGTQVLDAVMMRLSRQSGVSEWVLALTLASLAVAVPQVAPLMAAKRAGEERGVAGLSYLAVASCGLLAPALSILVNPIPLPARFPAELWAWPAACALAGLFCLATRMPSLARGALLVALWAIYAISRYSLTF